MWSATDGGSTLQQIDADEPKASTMSDIRISNDESFVDYQELCDVLPAPGVHAVHRDLDEAREWLRDWVISRGLATSDLEWEVIDRQNNPFQAACFYPDCQSREDALYCGAWLTWLLKVDDWFDQLDSRDNPDRAAGFVGALLQVTARARINARRPGGRADPIDWPSLNPLLTAGAELIDWACTSMSLVWRNRFLGHLDDWLRAYVTETENRAQKILLLPEDLIRIKRTCMAVAPCCDLVERLSVGELNPRVRRALAPLVDAVCDITGALNDLISLEKERACGDNHNLVESLMVHRSMSQEQAMGAVKFFIQQQAQELREKSVKIPRALVGHFQQKQARQWAKNCCTFARGYHSWSLRTLRYELEIANE
ncbi:terpene synthase family protein [Amycolatopsis thailandensis]|uniref:terpene synthase family protein n=1 Tax=Amycolatopsis thailandensis TaxID=589330 RepID=UPI0036332DC9